MVNWHLSQFNTQNMEIGSRTYRSFGLLVCRVGLAGGAGGWLILLLGDDDPLVSAAAE